MNVFRTPDERFENLPGYPYEPNYVEVGGLRLHHLDEGSGPTVLCFHGEPDWSYLYRHMLDALVESGHRVVCPDLVGFGRSDKPTDQDWYTYERHVEYVTRHLEQVELSDVTVVVQDWGGPIGLRWAVEHADQVGRLVVMNTGLFTGRVSKGFMAWREFAERTPDLPIGMIMQGATTTDLRARGDRRLRGAVPERREQGGRTALPAAGAHLGRGSGRERDGGRPAGPRRTGPSPRSWPSPTPIPVFPYPQSGEVFTSLIPTAGEQVRIEGAAHFLQEDRGPADRGGDPGRVRAPRRLRAAGG